MKSLLTRVLLAAALALLLGGCASFDASVEGGQSLQAVQRFFVVSNLNDNRALDHQIAKALKSRGLTAEVGPLTMMPDDTQAVVTYQDHWAWDFGEHLVFLKINVRKPAQEQSYASATFSAKVPLREPATVTLRRLVETLLEK
jgi:lysyl-tRNA synthetase class I